MQTDQQALRRSRLAALMRSYNLEPVFHVADREEITDPASYPSPIPRYVAITREGRWRHGAAVTNIFQAAVELEQLEQVGAHPVGTFDLDRGRMLVDLAASREPLVIAF